MKRFPIRWHIITMTGLAFGQYLVTGDPVLACETMFLYIIIALAGYVFVHKGDM